MAQVIGRLIDGKPLVDVTVADALPFPPEVSAYGSTSAFAVRHYRALLDTGADISCVCDNVVRECRLRQAGFIRMVGAVGPSLHATHIVRVGIVTGNMEDPDDGPRGLFQLDALEASAIRENQWFDLILGTDVLREHEFALTRGGGFKLSLF